MMGVRACVRVCLCVCVCVCVCVCMCVCVCLKLHIRMRWFLVLLSIVNRHQKHNIATEESYILSVQIARLVSVIEPFSSAFACMYVHIGMYAFVCVCVCVCERERERERDPTAFYIPTVSYPTTCCFLHLTTCNHRVIICQ